MKLSLDYLIARHEFWKNEIGTRGVWDASKFMPVEIRIKAKSKSYNGMFSRKTVFKNGKKIISDKITIYNNSDDFCESFLDSVLVHEMIHQYIFQNDIKDTRKHGQLFRRFRDMINREFKGRLTIKISDHNPSLPLKGESDVKYHIALVTQKDHAYFCVVNPAKLKYFDKLLKSYKKKGVIRDYSWKESNDYVFSNHRKCTTALHGLRKPLSEVERFCKEYGVVNS